jgi:hypothetical protein
MLAETILESSGIELLERIGLYLDERIDPRVDDGGIVLPSRFTHQTLELGEKGEADGRQDSRRPAARQRQRSTGRQGSTGRSSAGESRTASTPAPIFSQLGLNGEQVCRLEGVVRAYPQIQVRTTPDLLWLIFLIKPISGLDDTALLAAACPRNRINDLISWAWWWPALTWIGPRHTNYNPPGSICSFEPGDGTWQQGESLVTLLDLQIVWIVRHLFLRYFGRWPGAQVFHTPWERLTEQRSGELCGACDADRKYEGCCRPLDQARDQVEEFFLFKKWLRRNLTNLRLKDYQWYTHRVLDRRPPRALTEFVWGYHKDPPSLGELTPAP